MNYRIDDIRIQEIKELVPPKQLLAELSSNEDIARNVYDTRRAVHRILHGGDERLVVVIGPCSIHDPEAALEYARRVRALSVRVESDLLLVMRVYFEKPRTTVGWKGLINDPFLDNTFRINDGLRMARKLLIDVNSMGVPAATEYLDMITPQYVADLISWGAIGARTTESQVHRELASGLSCPVGFKNGTDGNTRIAIDAVRAARNPHHFLSVTKSGHSAIVSTSGNEDCHVILRGGTRPNYDRESVETAATALASQGLPAKVMIDCSHANSSKDFSRQREVLLDVAGQLEEGNHHVLGVMVESNLVSGRQDLTPGRPLVFGQSITDGCVGWDETEDLVLRLAQSAQRRSATLAYKIQ
ncbi:MAG: 3-deoxy-7-phosphoheptulonate synthase AroG [Bryobacterales bacterium]|nr:3-deoxy-7-phosphoheptulonate synthase AroG [Bryobacterales bacterium]